jgi:Reverse transcriptase (RNA-dependent DNA polymerase)
LEGEGLRCEANTGARPGFSTLHNIFTLQHFIDRSSPDRPLYCCFLDLSKAFDRVPRAALWEALQRLGVRGHFLNAIKSVYEHAHLTVVAEGSHGHIRPSQAGITQGFPLSPTLFGVVGDSLIRYIQSRCPNAGPFTIDRLRIPILGYVDDFVLLATSASDLQCLLSAVADWCEVFNMVVNCAKTRLMVFAGLGRHAPEDLSPIDVTFRGEPLEVVEQIRYLGVMFSSSLGLGATFPLLRRRMQLSWGTLLSQYGHLRAGVSIGLLLRLLSACVVPAGSYACEIWAFRGFGAPLPVGALAFQTA